MDRPGGWRTDGYTESYCESAKVVVIENDFCYTLYQFFGIH